MKILVLSERDDCCGPMAAAFLNDYSPKIEAMSAGRHPVQGLNPLLIVAMRECLIDLGSYQLLDVATLDLSVFDAVYECPDEPCPADLPSCRELRDRIKNESYLFFRALNPK